MGLFTEEWGQVSLGKKGLKICVGGGGGGGGLEIIEGYPCAAVAYREEGKRIDNRQSLKGGEERERS